MKITLVMVIMVVFLSSYDWQLGSLPLLHSILDLRNLATIAAILPGTIFYWFSIIFVLFGIVMIIIIVITIIFTGICLLHKSAVTKRYFFFWNLNNVLFVICQDKMHKSKSWLKLPLNNEICSCHPHHYPHHPHHNDHLPGQPWCSQLWHWSSRSCRPPISFSPLASSPQSEPFTLQALAGDCLDHHDDGVGDDNDYHSKVFACRDWSSPALRSPERQENLCSQSQSAKSKS